MSTREVIDVSRLPHAVLDHRSPIWWGNLVLVVIESVMFAILVAAYFYLRQNFEHWPPPRVNQLPVDFGPVPSLGITTINLAVIVLSFAPMLLSDRAALHRKRKLVDIGLWLTVALGLGSIALRFGELQALKFRWDDNAYASTIWMIFCLHLMHLIIGTVENGLMAVWVALKGLDDKHARDIRVTAVYWYWIVGTWIPLYLILVIGPHYF
jgi:cytochrome c oxidase subunit 3